METQQYQRCCNSKPVIFQLHIVPQPRCTKVTRWLGDEWSRGSYSYVAVGKGLFFSHRRVYFLRRDLSKWNVCRWSVFPFLIVRFQLISGHDFCLIFLLFNKQDLQAMTMTLWLRQSVHKGTNHLSLNQKWVKPTYLFA